MQKQDPARVILEAEAILTRAHLRFASQVLARHGIVRTEKDLTNEKTTTMIRRLITGCVNHACGP